MREVNMEYFSSVDLIIFRLSDFPATVQGINKRANRENWKYIDEPSSGRNGMTRKYHISSFPKPVQRQIYQQLNLFPEDEKESVEEIAKKNALHLSMKELNDPETHKKLKIYRQIKHIPYYKGRTQIISALCAEHGVSKRTIWRWVEQVESWKNPDRLRKYEIGEQKFKLPKTNKFCEDAKYWVVGEYLRNIHNGMKPAHNKLKKKAAEEGWQIGDYSNLTRLIKRLPQQLIDLAEKGQVGFEMLHTPKIRRAWLDISPYTVLCGDQKVSDYLVFEPETNQVYSMNYYLFIDCTSRYWAGMWPSFGPYNQYTYGGALREACRIGIPDQIYTDWGKPEESRYADDIRRRLETANIATGSWNGYREQFSSYDEVEKIKPKPGYPWPKPIENHMNLFERGLKDRFIGGYRKRDGDAWVNKQRQLKLKQERNNGKLLSVEEMFEINIDIIKDRNNGLMHVKESPDEPIVPADILRNGIADRPVYDEETLDFLFMPVFHRMVRQASVEIKVGKKDLRRYIIEPVGGAAIRRNEKVLVVIDPYDIRKPATICAPNGEYICQAEFFRNVSPLADDDEFFHQLEIQKKHLAWWKKSLREVTGTVRPEKKKQRKAQVIELKPKADVKPDKKKSDDILDKMYDKFFEGDGDERQVC
ncbi:MAG: hypothetical protein GY749_44585 [Desulfobacteraceae bacterium]|nr:hypothetical protein [Desulfobacteraceae bacterium]